MDLDEYQKKVVDSDDKDVIVLAGAGSGKTFTLLNKIRRLVDEGTDPESILVLTFTRTAALNLKERYVKTEENPSSADLVFCTFHSFCYRILYESYDVLDRLRYHCIPSVIESKEYEGYVSQALNLASCKLSVKDIEKARNGRKRFNGKKKLEYENFIDIYDNLIRKNNVIDYFTLCNSICHLFSDDDESIRYIKQKYQYLFVDEFQDTDKSQFEFVNSMNHCSRMLVGDPLQNIYQFRGCSNEPMKELLNSEDWIKFELPKDYRSTSQICDYINEASSNFKSKDYRIALVSDSHGPDVIETKYTSNHDLRNHMISEIKRVKNSGSTAILCRTNYEVDTCRQGLYDNGIDCNQRDVNYLIDLLNFFLSNHDERYDILVNRLSEIDYSKYENQIRQGVSTKAIFESNFFDSLDSFFADIRQIKHALSDNDMNYKMFILCSLFDVKACKELRTNKELLKHVLHEVQNSDASQIYVGTIHSAKGLEFDSVFVVGVDENQFTLNSEETENLFYTACTRARRNLIIFRHI